MVNISKFGDSAIKFTFTENDRYLYNGEITVPLNSLILVLDESDMVVIKKVDGDVFLTFLIGNTNFSSKADLESWFKENACGSTGGGSGSGVTSGEVQTMIDDALVPYAESSAVTEEITEAVSGKADTSAVTASITAAVSGKMDTDSFDSFYNSDYVFYKQETNEAIEGLNSAVSGKMDTSSFNTYSANTDARLAEDEEVTAAGLNELNAAVSGKADTTAVTASIAAAVSGKADSNSVYTKTEIDSALSGKQDTLIAGTNITISGNVISAAGGGGGNNVIELTQAEYDALTDIDPDAFYIITDAAGAVTTGQVQTMIDDSISGKADTSAVTASITAAVSGKQDTLVSGTNIKTINNESILGSGNIDIQGGGGKTISAGTNISVTTGETADTVSCTLPIISGSDNKVMIGYNNQQYINNYVTKAYGVSIGYSNSVNGQRAVCLGSDNHADGYCSVSINRVNSAMSEASFACGSYSKTSNKFEFASGTYNNSVSGSSTFGDSGNTLFSVGNGTADNARHNAFEIRQNGDIYITSGGTDIKLQDQLGGGLPESAFTTYTAATEVRLAEDEEVTAAALNSLNDATAANTTALGGLKLVQLTQVQYDALATKDANTLYVITGSN